MGKTVSGSVRPRPNTKDVRYFDIILELGKDPLTGKRKRVYYKADTTDRQEAENLLTVKKAEYLSGNMIEPSRQTVASFLDEYLRDYVQVQSSPATVKDYRNVVENYLKPEFGQIKLQDLSRARVQQVYNGWRLKSTKSDKPLRATTILHINRVFKAALNVACELEYIKENPARKVVVSSNL